MNEFFLRCYGGRLSDFHTRDWDVYATATATKPSWSFVTTTRWWITNTSSTGIRDPSHLFSTSTEPVSSTWLKRCASSPSATTSSTGAWTSSTWNLAASISTTSEKSMFTKRCARKQRVYANVMKKNSAMASVLITRSSSGIFLRNLHLHWPQG